MCNGWLSQSSSRVHRCPGWLRRLLRWAATCRDRARQRQQLAQMTCNQLKDIGLTRWDALREVEKPFWRL
jgi:uncharacterized protein YjiS (DUF1127 family)